MSPRTWISVAATIVMSLALSLTAAAGSITYYYTGSQFTSFSGGASCATSQCNLTGSMTLANPFGANAFSDPTSPTAFSFTDGHLTFDNSNSILINSLFATDGNGNITNWVVSGQLNNSGITWYQSVNWPQSQTGDLIQLGSQGDEQSFLAGSWSNTAPVTTPEPATWALLATGLLALAAFGWRRQALRS